MSQDTYAIIGASIAGARAAEALRRNGFAGRLLLLGEEPHGPYERPPLSKGVLLGTTTPETLQLRIDDWAADGIELITGDPVTELDPHTGKLQTASGLRLGVDKVLLATGGACAALPVVGADLPGVYALRDIDDATRLREVLLPGAVVVVIGGGFIGLEVAASARTLGCEVTVIEAASVPLARALGPEWGTFIAEQHIERGVRIGAGVGVTRIRGTDRAAGVELQDGTVLDADLVVVGVGMRPRTELAEQAGLEVQAGIVVDAGGRTSNPSIFAAGDVTVQPSWSGDRLVRYESYQNAEQQAQAAAAAMMGLEAPRRETPWFWSDQFDMNLQMAGELRGPSDLIIRGDRSSLSFAAFHLDAMGQVNGVFAVNRGRDVRAAMKLIENRTPVDRDELTDEGVDLRKLVKRSARPSLA